MRVLPLVLVATVNSAMPQVALLAERTVSRGLILWGVGATASALEWRAGTLENIGDTLGEGAGNEWQPGAERPRMASPTTSSRLRPLDLHQARAVGCWRWRAVAAWCRMAHSTGPYKRQTCSIIVPQCHSAAPTPTPCRHARNKCSGNGPCSGGITIVEDGLAKRAEGHGSQQEFVWTSEQQYGGEGTAGRRGCLP